MKLIEIKKKNGFSILAIILVIVAVIVAIGVWALSGESNSSSSQNSTSDIQASSLSNDIGTFKSQFDKLVINGYNADRITFKPNENSPYNLLDPSTGESAKRPPAGVIRGEAAIPEGIYVYSKGIRGNQIGTEKDDYGIIVAGVKASTCRRLNYTLYGSENIPKLSAVANAAAFVTGATATDPTTTATLDLLSNEAVIGWTNGCVASGSSDSDQNVFFRIMKPN